MTHLARQLLELQMKDLDGIPLSPDEQVFMARAELATSLFPGGLEDLLLRYALGLDDVEATDSSVTEPQSLRIVNSDSEISTLPAKDPLEGSVAAPVSVPRTRQKGVLLTSVAAYTVASLREAIIAAMRAGRSNYRHSFDIGGQSTEMDVFHIKMDDDDPYESSVEPIYHTDRDFVVERKGESPYMVTQYGGIEIPVKQLDNMELTFDQIQNKLILSAK